MHKRFVLNIIARIQLFVCLIMLIPLGWAAYDNIHSREVLGFVVTILGGIALALTALWKFPIKKEDFTRISTKDGLAIVGLSWIVLSATGALPLYISDVVPHYTDALFEIVSGYTTTGATIFTDIESLPRGILFWRSLTQWLGGMGIIVLYIALLPALGASAFQLYKAEAAGLTVERIEPRIKETAKNLWTVYFCLSLIQVVLYVLGDMPLFDALCHTFSTMASGGFSTKNSSIGFYGGYIQWVTIVFMFFAGANFVLHYRAFKGDILSYWKNEEFRFYCYLLLVLVPLFSVILNLTDLSQVPIRDAVFQILTILTSTGFATADFDMWPDLLRYTLFLLMFMGGCAGSTAGGMKLMRVYLSAKIAFASVVQTIFPNAIMPVKVNGRPLMSKLEAAVTAYFVLFMMVFFIGTAALILTESCDLVTAMSATVSCLSNIGPGLGKVGAVQNYGWISIPGKWVLSFVMLAGRLEFYSILILFLPLAWRK